MEMSSVASLIGTLGFPVVACILMAWYVKYITDKNREQMEAMETKHAEELKSMTDALTNNTVALTRLSEKLGCDSGSSVIRN